MKILMDLFDKKILKYTLGPLFLSLIFWGVIFFFFGDNLLNLAASYSQHFPYGETIAKIVNSAGWIVLILLYYLLSISTLGVFSSFFIDKIVLRINEKHYHLEVRKTDFKDMLKGLYTSFKSFLIYILIFVFTFWVLFIPIVNIFYQLFMWGVLTKKPLVFDSSYLFFNPNEIEQNLGIKGWIVVLLTSLIYFIPFISWFGYTIQLIFMTHLVLKKCKGKE